MDICLCLNCPVINKHLDPSWSLFLLHTLTTNKSVTVLLFFFVEVLKYIFIHEQIFKTVYGQR